MPRRFDARGSEREGAMPSNDLSILSMLRARMQWHQERQRVLAENVSNADTPRFRPRDLAPLNLERPERGGVAAVTVARTAATHVGGTLDGVGPSALDRRGTFEIRPTGNAVELEDEMLKVAANQMEFQAAATVYGKTLGLVRTALGKR
jgi:flagellar basal-body rod protein FlgB